MRLIPTNDIPILEKGLRKLHFQCWIFIGKLLDCTLKLGDDCNIISFNTNDIPISVIIKLLRYTNIDISLGNYWKFSNI